MTRFGVGTRCLPAWPPWRSGLTFDWLAFDLIALGLLAVLALGLGVVLRPSRLTIQREIAPPRVPKGDPAIALLTFANRGRRTVPMPSSRPSRSGRCGCAR